VPSSSPTTGSNVGTDELDSIRNETANSSAFFGSTMIIATVVPAAAVVILAIIIVIIVHMKRRSGSQNNAALINKNSNADSVESQSIPNINPETNADTADSSVVDHLETDDSANLENHSINHTNHSPIKTEQVKSETINSNEPQQPQVGKDSESKVQHVVGQLKDKEEAANDKLDATYYEPDDGVSNSLPEYANPDSVNDDEIANYYEPDDGVSNLPEYANPDSVNDDEIATYYEPDDGVSNSLPEYANPDSVNDDEIAQDYLTDPPDYVEPAAIDYAMVDSKISDVSNYAPLVGTDYRDEPTVPIYEEIPEPPEEEKEKEK